MALDYGELTARERARLKAAQRRAGIAAASRKKLESKRSGRIEDRRSPPPGIRSGLDRLTGSYEDTRDPPNPIPNKRKSPKRFERKQVPMKANPATVKSAGEQISRSYQEALQRPVRGEDARDKARAAPIGKLRSAFEDLQHNRIDAATFGRRLAAADMSPAELRDFERYSEARSNRVQRETFEANKRDLKGAARTVADVSGLTGAAWALTHPIERITNPEMNERMEFPWGFKPKAPKGLLPKGAPRPAGADKIVEALPEARRVRAKQQAGYRAERGKRGGKAAAAFEQAGGGQAGQIASKAALKGELPKLPFGRLAKEFGAADSEMRAVLQPQVDAMLDFITAHPSMQGRPLAAVGARDALTKAMDGVTPQKAEIRTLETIFGEEAAQHFKWRAAKERALKVANIPRSLQASYDLSLNLRQLLVSGTRHPVLLKRAFQTQLKAARSPAAARAILDEIKERPRYDQMLDDGVKLTEVRGKPGVLEEDFIGAEYAERIPIVGAGVRVSQRAFTAGGAKMRADLYDLFMDQAEKAGTPLTKRERQSFASVINAGTGRGGMGVDVLEKAAPLGTVLLFSPRLIASRLAFFNPYWYATLKGPARKEAATSLLSVLALGSSVLWLAKQLGAAVEDDPRSADFGKIQVGDTRVDIWGGFQQYAVNGFRYYKSETKGPDGVVKDKTREEILWNFASGKAAPLPGLARDLQRGRTFDYQPVDTSLAGVPYGRTVGKLFVPFGIQNAWDAKDDPKLAAASFGLGGIGLGMQTYSSEPAEKKKSKSLRGGSKKRSKSLRSR